ncbi:MAG TPA: uroporphyrinogen-III C-methyltransferase [Pyrinomonadaceae bacterium]|nr:uroporphyrinogen-III C-methyltransferase [Pyrinomonadaceae bacterium]
MRSDLVTGILVVGHGSRRREANDDIRDAAQAIAQRGGFVLVEPAFLEIEHPNVSEGFARLVARGAKEIVVHPYFLSPGRHTRGDIPVEVQAAATEHPGIRYRISEPLSGHPLVISASIERIRESISSVTVDKDFTGYQAKPGTVYLVGAGPGDPGLLTVKARDLIASCDVIFYDYLVNPDILNYAHANVERVYAGKVGGARQTPQDQINADLVGHALLGMRVVRLKGGDPFLFGRGGEEAEALAAAGIPFEIVPGISSALAVPAYAGIPLTHRDHSSSVTVLTGARANDGEFKRNLLLSSPADTLVILMGVRHLRAIVADLVAAGRSGETPVAVIRWGSYEGQQTVCGTIDSIADAAAQAEMRAPAVIVIGEVVKLRERLQWFENAVKSSLWEELELVGSA